MKENWLLYGATGFTGKLIIEEAVKKGHKPILAGRNAEKVKPLAQKYGLEYKVFDLSDATALDAALTPVKTIFLAAGPFINTHQFVIDSCLRTKTNYLDITGEMPVFQNIYSYDAKAIERNIAFIPGVGFDVVPTDCLASHVAGMINEPTHLEIAIFSNGTFTSGTLKTMMTQFNAQFPNVVNGKFVFHPVGSITKKIFMAGMPRTVTHAPIADLLVAQKSLGIKNITTYFAMPDSTINVAKIAVPILSKLLSFKPIKSLAQSAATAFVNGPDEKLQQNGRTCLYASVTNAAGEKAEAWLESIEAYRMTAISSVLAVEDLHQWNYEGALTPAQAFGPDFVLRFPNTTRTENKV